MAESFRVLELSVFVCVLLFSVMIVVWAMGRVVSLFVAPRPARTGACGVSGTRAFTFDTCSVQCSARSETHERGNVRHTPRSSGNFLMYAPR